MLKCKCDVEPEVVEGKAEEIEGTEYWKLTFRCKNPNCENYQKNIGVQRINALDNSEVIEEVFI